MLPITRPYLLVTGIDSYLDQQGRRYLDHLWYKDLVEHLHYLKDFTLAAPCRQGTPPADAVLLESDPRFATVKFIDLPTQDSFLKASLKLPSTLSQLWEAIGRAEIVHAGVAGWPIPMGWLVTPIARLRKKFYLIIVESAFWRVEPGAPKSFKNQLRANFSETVNRWCLNRSNLAIFTQDDYRKSLLTQHPERGYVIHASWIDGKNVLSDAEAATLWQQKKADSTPPRILFVGRLIASKGVSVLLQAMKQLSAEQVPIRLDILGQGELRQECEAASQQLSPPTEVHLLGTVPYDAQFFKLLQTYHAIVVPSISDEQPRIVYDAYSQAVPILASNTAGLRDCVRDRETGLLFPLNDPDALAVTLKGAAQNPDQLEQLGLAALAVARDMTHQEMHRKRWQLLLERLGELDSSPSA